MARGFFVVLPPVPDPLPGCAEFFGFRKISPCSESSYDDNPFVFNLTTEPVMKSRPCSKSAGGKRPGSYFASEPPPKPLENTGSIGAITTLRGLHGVAYPGATQVFHTGRRAPVSNATPNSHQI